MLPLPRVLQSATSHGTQRLRLGCWRGLARRDISEQMGPFLTVDLVTLGADSHNKIVSDDAAKRKREGPLRTIKNTRFQRLFH
jgi:hypothetical protein